MATIPAYGIFEGGGAKGLGHVAGVKAAEQSGVKFIGVAGASAGALIAALVAVGYTADELFNPDDPAANLLTRHRITPLDLLGEGQWEVFARAEGQARRAALAGAVAGVAGAWLAGRHAVRVARTVKRDGGFFTTETVRDTLNLFLRRKLREHHGRAGRAATVPDRVRFCDMDPTVAPECCTLKVIVTDITHQRMEILGRPETAQVEVAEAVAASISIPAVFKPARIPSYDTGAPSLYADGGMVSNLPIWVFAEEKLAYERERLPDGRVPILAFTLTDPPPAQAARAAPRLYGPREGTGDYWTGAARAMRPVPAPGSGAYWASVGRAGIFGGQAVAQRFAADVRMVSMPVGLEVTGFNFTQEEALAAYFDARDAASLVMTREVVLRPQETAGKLDSFRRVAAFVSGVALADLRVSLITPLSAGSFKVISGAGMEHDADDRLNFGRDAPGAPVAYAERRPAYIDFAALRAAGQAPGMTKYERALVPPRIVAAICLPVFADFGPWGEPDPARRPPPLGVVSIDSSVTLTQLFNDTKALAQVVAASIALAPLLAP